MIRATLLTICCVHWLAAASKPIVRASIDSTRPIIVGQAVPLNVTVLVPNYFTGAPNFPELEIENAIVLVPQDTPLHSVETIGELSFAGISVSYTIYPQQPGTFRVPPAQIAFKYAADPPQSIEARLSIPPTAFEAVIPPQAADLDYFLPTDSLVLKQEFEKPMKKLQVGDTVTRTVTVSVSKLRAMLIPPTKFEAPDGIAVYPKQPAVNDIKTVRNEFVEGRRVDSVTYLIQKEGDYTLPEIRVEWWNLAKRKVQVAALQSVHFTAAPNPSDRPELAPELEPVPAAPARTTKSLRDYVHVAEIGGGLTIAIAFLLWARHRFGNWMGRRWRESRLAYKNSEVAFFRKLKKACRAGQKKEAYALLLAWSHRFSRESSLDRFLSSVGDAERQVQLLSSELYGSSSSAAWSGKHMIKALQRVRRRRRETRYFEALPPLNPQSDSK